jgi:uncharacterized membrane protein
VILLVPIASGANSSHGRSIDDVLAEIREAQGIQGTDPIDPDLVSDRQLEALGDAVMSYMHPNDREHEFMDSMMGGEGSDRLAYMHRMMGLQYLTGTSHGRGFPMMGWGARGRRFGTHEGNMPMMGWGMHGRRGSEGYGIFPGALLCGVWAFFIWRIVIWIVILGIIGVVIWLVVRTQGQHGVRSGQEETPLEIVRRRYARGEVSREEFENLKRDLR